MKKNLIEKGFKDIIKTSPKERPVLACVHFDADGSIAATNSHGMLRIRDYHTLGQSFNLDLNTFLPFVGKYPDLDRLISTKSGNTVFELDAKQLETAYAFVQGLRRDVFVTMLHDGAAKTVSLICGAVQCVIATDIPGNEGWTTTFNPTTLKPAFALYRELVKQTDWESVVRVHFYEELRPLRFETHQTDYLICPVRTR